MSIVIVRVIKGQFHHITGEAMVAAQRGKGACQSGKYAPVYCSVGLG